MSRRRKKSSSKFAPFIGFILFCCIFSSMCSKSPEDKLPRIDSNDKPAIVQQDADVKKVTSPSETPASKQPSVTTASENTTKAQTTTKDTAPTTITTEKSTTESTTKKSSEVTNESTATPTTVTTTVPTSSKPKPTTQTSPPSTTTEKKATVTTSKTKKSDKKESTTVPEDDEIVDLDETSAITSKEEVKTSKTSVTTKRVDSNTNFDKYYNEDQQDTSETYVLNTSTMKFHYSYCRVVPKIKPENYSTSSKSISELLSMGYNPCGHCSPH